MIPKWEFVCCYDIETAFLWDSIFIYLFIHYLFIYLFLFIHLFIWNAPVALNIPHEQNGRRFMDDIFRCIRCISWMKMLFYDQNLLLKFVPKGPIDNNSALV